LEHTNFGADLFGKVQTFFMKKFLFWLEVLSLTSQIGLASPAFSILNVWLAASHDVSVIAILMKEVNN